MGKYFLIKMIINLMIHHKPTADVNEKQTFQSLGTDANEV